jgi:hypothetical protein
MEPYIGRQGGGISPCLSVGAHSGVEPKIIVYEEE